MSAKKMFSYRSPGIVYKQHLMFEAFDRASYVEDTLEVFQKDQKLIMCDLSLASMVRSVPQEPCLLDQNAIIELKSFNITLKKAQALVKQNSIGPKHCEVNADIYISISQLLEHAESHDDNLD